MSFQLRSSVTAAYLFCLYASLGIARPVAEYLRARNLLRLTVLALFTLALPAVLRWRAAAAGRTKMLLRLALVAMLLTAAFVLAKTPEERLHFLTYSLLGWLLAWSLEEKNVSPLLTLLLVWLAGTGDELIQGWLPDRVFDLRDILFNGLAGTAGTALFATGASRGFRS
jgi:VanZ family protein